MNMGARALELPHSYSVGEDGAVKLHVAQLPPNPALFVPGPAVLCVLLSLSLSPSLGQPDVLLSPSLCTQLRRRRWRPVDRARPHGRRRPARRAAHLARRRSARLDPSAGRRRRRRRLLVVVCVIEGCQGAQGVRLLDRHRPRRARQHHPLAFSASPVCLLRLSFPHRHSRLYLRLMRPLQPLSPHSHPRNLTPLLVLKGPAVHVVPLLQAFSVHSREREANTKSSIVHRCSKELDVLQEEGDREKGSERSPCEGERRRESAKQG